MKELKIRQDRTPTVLRRLAKAEADARIARRMLAIANALEGDEPGRGCALRGMATGVSD